MFLLHKKRSAMDRTAADKNYVAEATRRRRRILRAGFFFMGVGSFFPLCFPQAVKAAQGVGRFRAVSRLQGKVYFRAAGWR